MSQFVRHLADFKNCKPLWIEFRFENMVSNFVGGLIETFRKIINTGVPSATFHLRSLKQFMIVRGLLLVSVFGFKVSIYLTFLSIINLRFWFVCGHV